MWPSSKTLYSLFSYSSLYSLVSLSSLSSISDSLFILSISLSPRLTSVSLGSSTDSSSFVSKSCFTSSLLYLASSTCKRFGITISLVKFVTIYFRVMKIDYYLHFLWNLLFFSVLLHHLRN